MIPGTFSRFLTQLDDDNVDIAEMDPVQRELIISCVKKLKLGHCLRYIQRYFLGINPFHVYVHTINVLLTIRIYQKIRKFTHAYAEVRRWMKVIDHRLKREARVYVGWVHITTLKGWLM